MYKGMSLKAAAFVHREKNSILLIFFLLRMQLVFFACVACASQNSGAILKYVCRIQRLSL